MTRAAILAVVLAAAALCAASSIGSAAPRVNAGRILAVPPSRTVRPNVVENGNQLVLLPLPAPQDVSELTFAPDGTAYFMNDSNEVDRVSPDGTYAKISVPGAYSYVTWPLSIGKIIYVRGNLWMSSMNGLVEVAADGSHRHSYSLGGMTGPTLGPDGAIYATAYPPSGRYSVFYRIGSDGAVRSTRLPVILYNLVSNRDGNLYADYGVYDNPYKGGLVRFHPSGGIDLIPTPGFVPIPPLASSNGNVYTEAYYFKPPLKTALYELMRLDRNENLTHSPLPSSVPSPVAPTIFGDLSVDQGGSLWMVISEAGGSLTSLYRYNVGDGRFSKAIDPNDISELGGFFGQHVTVGPDDNIWFAAPNSMPSELVAYVRHVQTLEPVSLMLRSGTPVQFTILETNSNGPWTAQSLNPSVAAVSPGSSATGAFAVTETGVGMTSIAVRDRLGNVSYELVTTR